MENGLNYAYDDKKLQLGKKLTDKRKKEISTFNKNNNHKPKLHCLQSYIEYYGEKNGINKWNKFIKDASDRMKNKTPWNKNKKNTYNFPNRKLPDLTTFPYVKFYEYNLDFELLNIYNSKHEYFNKYNKYPNPILHRNKRITRKIFVITDRTINSVGIDIIKQEQLNLRNEMELQKQRTRQKKYKK